MTRVSRGVKGGQKPALNLRMAPPSLRGRCAATSALLLLLCVQTHRVGSMVEILEPADGDKSLPH